MAAKTEVLHYPRLDTVLMVEDTLKKCKDYPTRTGLWRALPKQVMYQTFLVILDYLQQSNKIVMRDGQVIWIWDPEGVKKYLNSKLIAR
jgi:hypothetical protein